MLQLSDKLKRKTSRSFMWSFWVSFAIIGLTALGAVFYKQNEAVAQTNSSQYERRLLVTMEERSRSLKIIADELHKIRLALEKRVEKDGKK